MNFDAAIFDLDGTLLDTMDIWDGILAATLRRRGLREAQDYAAAVHSLSFTEAAEYTIARFGLAEPPEALLREWDESATDEYARRVQLLPGAIEYLHALREARVRLAVATGLPGRLFLPCLERLGICGMFDALCSTEETGSGKNRPDVFLLAASRLGVPPERCIVFDDSPAAVRSAQLAGMYAVEMRPDTFANAPVPGELWDLYDGNRAGTQRTMRRGDAVPEGLYHLSVSGWVISADGRILLTRRAAGKSYPLLWECTGGCALSGKDSLTAMLRELREELGPDAAAAAEAAPARLIHSARRAEDFYDVYAFTVPSPPPLRLQREEVAGAKWVTPSGLKDLRERGELHPLLDTCELASRLAADLKMAKNL